MPQDVKRLSRMDAVQAPIIPVVAEIMRRHPGTISLGQGVVHYGPPREAIDAARAALLRPETHGYGAGGGEPALLAAIERKLGTDNGIDVARGLRTMVTAGGNLAFMHALLSVTAIGDEFILPVPYYFNHEMAGPMFGCTAVPVPTDRGYQLDVEAIRRAITPKTRAIVTVSPNNPTGAVYTEPALRGVSALCREHGLYHISDEVYEYFTYGGARHVSPGAWPGAEAYTISLFSLSKAYGFAGWRIGYMAYPGHLHGAVLKAQDTLLVCPPVLSQVAAVAAMEVGPSYCREQMQAFAEVREIVLGELQSLEPLCTLPTVEGAFYAFLRVNVPCDQMQLVERLIREHKVAVLPGMAFGMTDGVYLRVAYGALQKATVAEGIGRLVRGLRAILG